MFWCWLIINFFFMFNFNWFNSEIHNFSLKNKIFSIDLNFFRSILSYDFLFFNKTFWISLHVKSCWLVILTRLNRNSFEFEFFFVSFNSCITRSSTFQLIRLFDACAYFYHLIHSLIDFRHVSLKSLFYHSSFLIDKRF